MKLFFFSLLIFVTSAHVQAADLDEDVAVWTGVFYNKKISDKWSGFFELQGRYQDLENGAKFERLLARPAIVYHLTENLSLWGGYGFTPLFDPSYQPENRLWQQLQFSKAYGISGQWQVTERFRFEERDISGSSAWAYRVRFLLRAQYYTSPEKNFSLVGYDEIFHAIARGFDQNRIFFGVNQRMGDGVRVEAGYLNIHLNRKTPRPDRMSHALSVFFVINQ